MSGAVAVAGRTGAGVDILLAAMDRMLALDPVSRVRFRLPVSEGGLLHLLHEHGRVLSNTYQDDVCEVEAEVPESVKRRLTKYVAE
jgi:GTP-binding protein HflX